MRESLIEKVFYEKGKLLTLQEATSQALLFLDYISMSEAD